ncbi:DUF2905 domain-containing protein [Desulfonatronum sp. SC1]|nr:DUF2905 domain-containing protein [Desulfonatronum sp. SC1]
MGRYLIGIGLLLVAIGLIWRYAPWLVQWFGKLPGDIRYESGRTRVLFPITSMIVVSIALTILINLFRK